MNANPKNLLKNNKKTPKFNYHYPNSSTYLLQLFLPIQKPTITTKPPHPNPQTSLPPNSITIPPPKVSFNSTIKPKNLIALNHIINNVFLAPKVRKRKRIKRAPFQVLEIHDCRCTSSGPYETSPEVAQTR